MKMRVLLAKQGLLKALKDRDALSAMLLEEEKNDFLESTHSMT